MATKQIDLFSRFCRAPVSFYEKIFFAKSRLSTVYVAVQRGYYILFKHASRIKQMII